LDDNKIHKANETSSLLSNHIPHSKPGKSRSPALQVEMEVYKMEIRQPAHLLPRRDLMRFLARPSSLRIRQYSVPVQQQQRKITIWSPNDYVRLLEDLVNDPCGDNATAAAGARIVDHFQD
jgi:hypothetical protein